MTAIASRNPFDLLSDDGEPSSGAMTVAPVKKKGAASLAAPASDISSKTSAAAAQINKGPRNNNNNNNNRTKDGSQHSNYNSSSQSSRDNKGGENRNRSARPDGERRPYVQRGPGPASGEGALYEKFPKGTGSHKNDASNGSAARGPRAGRGGRANNDRHSKDGRRDNEKRHGGGAANWGNEEQDAHKVEHLDGNNATEALKEIVDGDAGLDANGDTTTPAEEAKEEDETPQLTLEEYRAQLAAQEKTKAVPKARTVDQAEALKGFVPVERKNEEDFYVGKTEKAKKEKKEAKAKQVLLIEQKFNEAPRPPRGEGGDRRGSRGGSNSGNTRGGGRGGNARGGSFGGRGGNSAGRGGARGGAPSKNTAQAADLNDDKLFPSLQR